MTDAEIYDALNDIFRDVLVDDTISLKPETTANDIEGWDSFSNIILIVAAEERFGVKLNSREIEGLKNVAGLVALIQQKMG